MNTVTTAQEPKRQHLIPKMLQKNFQDSDGNLHAYNKDQQQPFEAASNNIFVQKHRYTQYRPEDDDQKFEVEHRLSAIESAAAPIIQRIVKCRKARDYPRLAEEDGDAVKLFWMTFFLRTNYHANEIVPFDHYENLFRREFSKQAEIHLADEHQRKEWEGFQQEPGFTQLIRKELIHDLRARVAAGLTPRIAAQVEEFMRDAGLLIAMPGRRASGFILGDCGGVCVPARGRSGGFHSWLPVSREVVIGPTPDPENVNYMNLYRQDVNRINWTTFETSDIVVAKRKSDLDYVVRRWQSSRIGT